MTGPRHAALAAEIRSELGRQEVTRRELARRIEKPDTTVARWLRGGTSMDLDDIYSIAGALGVDPLDLIRRAEIEMALTGTTERYPSVVAAVIDLTSRTRGYLSREDSPAAALQVRATRRRRRAA